MYNSLKTKTQPAQVYFPMDMYIEIKKISKNENKAIAEWIRDIVSKEVWKKQQKKKAFSSLPTFNWETKEKNISEKIDQIIYK